MVLVLSVLPNRWTTQIRTLLVSTVYATNADELALTDDDKLKAWVKRLARFLNVGFEWPSNVLSEPPNCRPPLSVFVTKIRKALIKMNCGKTVGLLADILKAAGEEGVELVGIVVGAVFSSGMIPVYWEESFIVNFYKVKDEALYRGNYRLTHWGRDEMDAILQTTFSKVFSSMKMFELRFHFHWRVQLTIFHHWFR